MNNMDTTYIEQLYREYIGTEEYTTSAPYPGTDVYMAEARESIKIGPEDGLGQAFTGGELNGFVVGFKYAARIFRECGPVDLDKAVDQPPITATVTNANKSMLDIDGELNDIELVTEKARYALREVVQNYFNRMEVSRAVRQSPLVYMTLEPAAAFANIVEDYLARIAEVLASLRAAPEHGEETRLPA